MIFSFNKTALLAVTVAVLPLKPAAAATAWELSWKTTNLPNPESIVYDPVTNTLFVSNQDLDGELGEASIWFPTILFEVLK